MAEITFIFDGHLPNSFKYGSLQFDQLLRLEALG